MSQFNEEFKKYIREKISPKNYEKIRVRESHEELSDMLKGDNFRSGSYARFTAITPVNDLDVIWELPEDILAKTELKKKILTKNIDAADLDISNILSELAKRLRVEYKVKNIKLLKIEAQSHSVGVYFGPTEQDFSIDIVPAIPEGINSFGEKTYLVPEILKINKKTRLKIYSDHSLIKWVKSDPRGYIKEAAILNEVNQNYRHAIKFCKKWKLYLIDRYPELKFKSFHIEMIIKDIITCNISLDSLDVVKKFFGNISDYLKEPQIFDRADNSKYIDEYLNEQSQENKNLIIKEGVKSLLVLNSLDVNSNINNCLDSILNCGTSRLISKTVDKTISPISRPYA